MQRSPLRWIGGKSRGRKFIIPLIPEHQTYVEVFSGAAWVLFGKPPEWSRAEVLNDVNDELVNFYGVMKRNRTAFVRQFRWALISRTRFNDLLRQDPAKLSAPERAARFYYLIKCSFSGDRRTYHITRGRTPDLNVDRLQEIADGAWQRLRRVNVEHLDFEKCLRLYDAPETFFYCDPPYIRANYYGYPFEDADHERLAKTLRGVRGKFLLSINDCALARQIYGKFQIAPVSATYGFGNVDKSSGAHAELIITNYRPVPRPL